MDGKQADRDKTRISSAVARTRIGGVLLRFASSSQRISYSGIEKNAFTPQKNIRAVLRRYYKYPRPSTTLVQKISLCSAG
ncbi:hypothetical protein WG66_017139 [Moniliophthora roreri]|nr:hypothetical protein WG66_017139 [Moniliophthora roreri]